MANKNYVGDVGVLLKVDTVSDISGDSTHLLMVRKPSGAIVTWNATVTDGHYLYYTTVSGDLDEAGIYKIQAKIDNPILGETFKMQIYEHYN